MSVSKLLRLSSATLLIYVVCVLWHLPRCFAQTPSCLVKQLEVTNRNFRYSSTVFLQHNLSDITVPCTLAQVNISKLYLEGDCMNDDCSVKANATSCSSVFIPGNYERNYWNLSLLPEQKLSSESVCGVSVPIRSYLYINTSCTNFNTSWVSLQLYPDPADCYSAYKYGAAIGIVVAAVVFVALLVGGWIFWYRRRSRKGTYEPHHDIHMQPYADGAGHGLNDQGYRSSSLPARQLGSTDRQHSGFPAAGTSPGTVVQGTPVYPPWTGGGFKPPAGSTSQ
ncbi:hypothetical protein ABBQ32_005729 [Trebouxia sp. C0010 RCD-2024]